MQWICFVYQKIHSYFWKWFSHKFHIQKFMAQNILDVFRIQSFYLSWRKILFSVLFYNLFSSREKDMGTNQWYNCVKDKNSMNSENKLGKILFKKKRGIYFRLDFDLSFAQKNFFLQTNIFRCIFVFRLFLIISRFSTSTFLSLKYKPMIKYYFLKSRTNFLLDKNIFVSRL